MTFYVENGTEESFDFDVEELTGQVARAVLLSEKCPFEGLQCNVLLTDGGGIREFNRQYRGIDRETDVLSFPNLDLQREGDFTLDESRRADYFDPDSGELILGDIILNVDRVKEQAESYGHSERREFAFLIAHSMLHLCGYDHMEQEAARVMEEKQEAVLTELGITRDERRVSDHESDRGKASADTEYCLYGRACDNTDVREDDGG